MNTDNCSSCELHDYGNDPFVVNIDRVAKLNTNFRTALWTGRHLQVTLMSLLPGEDIGLEMHPDLDQFLKIESGRGTVKMGRSKDNMNIQKQIDNDFAVIVPAGTWHNIRNTGNSTMKIYSIYAPVQHPYGTVHRTKAIAMKNEHH